MTRRTAWLPLVMVGLFVAAVVYVNPLAPERTATDQRAADHAAHGSTTDGGDGLADNHDGYLLSPVALPDRRGTALPVIFQIRGPDGTPTTAYQPTMGEALHLYVLREDLSFYQHLHPTFAGDSWTAAVDVPDGGVYRLYAEFVPEERAGGHPIVLSTPFVVAGDTRYVPIPPPAPRVSVGRLTVSRPGGATDAAAGRPDVLRFQVLDARGAPVTALEPYLGTYGHISLFEASTQRLTHLHPTVAADAPGDGVLTFHAQFPQRGRYRLFLQFKVAGAVSQAAFTVLAR